MSLDAANEISADAEETAFFLSELCDELTALKSFLDVFFLNMFLLFSQLWPPQDVDYCDPSHHSVALSLC